MNSVCNSSQSPFLLFIKPHSPTISCSIRRRRPNRHNNNNNNNNYYSSSNNPYSSSKRSSQSSEQNVEMVIDVERIKAQAATTFKSVSRSVRLGLDQFVLSGKDTYKDLQTLICFDNNGRIYVSCKRSSLLFMGDVLIYSLLLFFGVRFLARLAVGIRNKIGLGHGGSGSVVVRRDRSLGGKQVVVGNHGRMKENVKALNNPLMPSWETALKDMESGLKDRVRTSNKLPAWWPALLTEPSLMVDIEENQGNANRLIRAIMDNRMGGQDIFNSDIVQLRRICRASGVRVNIETKNVRDSICRAAVDLVLNSCSSTISETASVEIDGEDARQFIAGLADNVGLERIRAARIVSAGVAARTRSYILQAWALEMQGKHIDALVEVSKICRIHRVFPPEESSPEMEMVARGLEKHLKLEQRELLMDMLLGVCTEDTHRSLAEALGLGFASKADFNHQQENYT